MRKWFFTCFNILSSQNIKTNTYSKAKFFSNDFYLPSLWLLSCSEKEKWSMKKIFTWKNLALNSSDWVGSLGDIRCCLQLLCHHLISQLFDLKKLRWENKKTHYKLHSTLIRRWNVRLTWVWYKTNGLVSRTVVSKLKKEGEGSWSHLTQCLGFKYSVSLLIFSLSFSTGSAKIRRTSADLNIFFFFFTKLC